MVHLIRHPPSHAPRGLTDLLSTPAVQVSAAVLPGALVAAPIAAASEAAAVVVAAAPESARGIELYTACM